MADSTGGIGVRVPEAALAIVDDGYRQWGATPTDMEIGVVRLPG
jgi:hypothetical protein